MKDKKNVITAVLLVFAGLGFLFITLNKNEYAADKPAEVRFENGLPVKPENIAYVNTSSLAYLDRIAKFELVRGGKIINAELGMVILNELPAGKSLENYANEVFRKWDLGRNNNGRGILYVLVQQQGLLKIETSYELESVFPDVFIHSYQDTIKNFFHNGQLGDAISHLIVEMVHRVQDNKYEMSLYKANDQLNENLAGGGGIAAKGYYSSRIDKNLTETNKADLSKYAAASTAEEALLKFIESLNEGISSPDLGILTEGSRYMAMEYKRSPGYQRNRGRAYEKAMPYEIYEQDGYAFARFKKNSVRPVFMRRDDDGLWYVDETKMWAYADGFVKADSDHYYVQAFSSSSPWSFAVNFPGDELMQGLICDRPPPLPLSVDIKQLMDSLEEEIRKNPNNAKAYFTLADLLFFENYWIKDAITAVENGLILEPKNERYLRRAIFFGSKMPDYRYTEAHFKTLMELHPEDKHIKWHYECFMKSGANCSKISVTK